MFDLDDIYSTIESVKESDMEKEYIQRDIEILFNDNEYLKAIKYLDYLKKRNEIVDFVTEDNESIPMLILHLKENDTIKTQILENILKKYQIDLNRNIMNSGNILINSFEYTKCKEWYKILIKYGANINSIDEYNYPYCTILDKVLEYDTGIDLFIFFRKEGAKTWREMHNLEKFEEEKSPSFIW
jgi:hypothetical protein